MRYTPLPVLTTVMRRSTDPNFVRGAFAPAGTVMASLRQTTGQQRVEAGMTEDQIDIIVRFPICAFSLAITVEDRLVINNLNYAIKTVSLPDRRGGFIEITGVLSIGN